MTEYSKETSFWHLLKEKRIVIPIIQRDYAQGRIGKEYLRQRFLGQLLCALKTDTPESKLVLDFVYGSTEGNILYPLDGQQRLTTLWLLHWYLALRAGALDEDGQTLRNFSYETRTSSRIFCDNLCKIKASYKPETDDVVSYVTNVGIILLTIRILRFNRCFVCLEDPEWKERAMALKKCFPLEKILEIIWID